MRQVLPFDWLTTDHLVSGESTLHQGRFPFSQNFRNFQFGGKWNTFHWKIPTKSGKSKKVVPFSRLEFPNGMSCSIYVSRSLYQYQVHGRAPPRTGVYDQMEQLFTNRKFHFCSHRNFRVFFLNGKRPRLHFFQLDRAFFCLSTQSCAALFCCRLAIRASSPGWLVGNNFSLENMLIIYIPHNYVIPQAMPHAISQTYSALYRHR